MEGYCNGSKDDNNSTSRKISLLNDNISPINLPLGDKITPALSIKPSRFNHPLSAESSTLIRFLRSGSSSDENSTPNCNRPIINYQYRKSGGSCSSTGSNGGGSSNRRGFRPRAPLSSVENLEKSPVVMKVEEDVLVMDALGPVMLPSDDSKKLRSLMLLDSPWPGGSSPHKMEICLSWEDSGSCRYGHKCQFAHGKEELHPTPIGFHKGNESEISVCEPYSSPGSYMCNLSGRPEIQRVPQVKTPAAALKFKSSPVELNLTQISRPAIKSTDWTPLDDGIEVTLPHSANTPLPREAIDEYIHNLLYGTLQKKRLPVFVDICPE